MSSESSRQGDTKRINPTISIPHFCPLLRIYACQTLDLDLVSVHASQVGKQIYRVFAHFEMLPFFAIYDPV